MIAIIGDTHFGVKKNSEVFLDGSMRFFYDQLIPHIIKNKLSDVIFLGDIFDNRVNVNIKVLNDVRTLMKSLAKICSVHIILGNHDLYFNSTVDVHSADIFSDIDNVTVYEKLTVRNIGGKDIILCPWVIDYDQFASELNDLNGDLVLGHFDIIGCKMGKYSISTHGLEPFTFAKFPLVMSGHYHTRSTMKLGKSDIMYTGTPYQLTRDDIGDLRGFYVVGDDIEFVENIVSPKFMSFEFPNKVKCTDIKGNIVYISVPVSLSSDKKVDKYIDAISGCNPVSGPFVMYTTDDSDVHTGDIDIDTNLMNSIPKLLEEYVNNVVDFEDKQRLIDELLLVYGETNNGETSN